MQKTPNTRLWTPIANALESYRRRALKMPDATYEHLWRLIHIQEALIVTLGSALATRLLTQWLNDDERIEDLSELRAMLTGLPKPGDDPSVTQEQSTCLAGNIGGWIDFLTKYGQPEEPDGTYRAGLLQYLGEKREEPLAFLRAWQGIAQVPLSYTEKNLKRIGTLHAINTLRNKLAHVPLPEKLQEELYRGLRSEVFRLLSPDHDKYSRDHKADFRATKWHTPLQGLFFHDRNYVTGTTDYGSIELTTEDDTIPSFVVKSDGGEVENWSAGPFLRFDGELKVSLLFRQTGLGGDSEDGVRCEYHRFAAEAQAVETVTISSDLWDDWVPKTSQVVPAIVGLEPTPEVISRKEVVEPEHIEELPPRELRSRAEEAFSRKDYKEAVRYFDALEGRPAEYGLVEYNDVARSKHGGSLRRVARYLIQDVVEQDTAFSRAFQLLKEAQKHRDISYRAKATNELSRAHFDRWSVFNDPKDFYMALKCAREATNMDYNPIVMSWLERLEDIADDNELTQHTNSQSLTPN